MTIFGRGKFRYELVKDWGKLPAGITYREVPGVAVNSKDHVYLFTRGPNPVIVFDREGRFLMTWGDGIFTGPHGVTIGPDDAVYLTDYMDHTVRKFTPGGRLLMTLGVRGQASDTGVTGDWTTVKRGGPPFNRPANLAVAPDGSLYVADGYGNARVHHFSAEGQLLHSWGEPGTGPGQFMLPHGIRVAPDSTVYVADRENNRIQRFSPEGRYLTQWTHVSRPADLWFDRDGHVYVAELGEAIRRNPNDPPPDQPLPPARVQIFTLDGTPLGGWGGEQSPCAPGDFIAPHGICIDSRGDLYVAEVTDTAAISKGKAPADCHVFQKFTRV